MGCREDEGGAGGGCGGARWVWGCGGGPHLSGLPACSRRLADEAAFLLRRCRGLALPEEELCLRRLGGTGGTRGAGGGTGGTGGHRQ